MKRILTLLMTVLAAAWPVGAWACPFCFGATPFANGLLWAAILLLPMPFLMVGGLIVWIAKQSKKEDSPSEEAPPSHPMTGK